MKLVFVLFDSLNRLALESYGGEYINPPNFNRFAQRAVSFDRHYVGSLPCMSARRDVHTGRVNFLHRNWGPLEPFDNSFPDLIKKNGGYGHIITDHYHYFHDGGETYHNRYNSWEFVRGQSTDDWKGVVDPPLDDLHKLYHKNQTRPFTKNDMINRTYIRDEAEFSCPQVFDLVDHFLEVNKDADN
jgi:arylsulfatase A-like enzyme